MSYKRSKGKAKELLFANGNHFVFVIAFVIAITMCVMPLVALTIVGDVISDGLLGAIFYISLLILFAPLVSGLYRMAGLAYNRKEFGIIDIFYAFSSIKNYFRVLLVDIIVLFKLVIPVLTGLGWFAIWSTVFTSVLGVKPLIAVSAVAVALLTLPLIKRLYAVSYLVCTEEMGVVSAIKCSWRYTKDRSIKLTLAGFSFLPESFLSAIALMVPFLIYNFPFRLCLYSVICGELKRESERKTINEFQNDICPEAIASGVEDINEQHS